MVLVFNIGIITITKSEVSKNHNYQNFQCHKCTSQKSQEDLILLIFVIL